MTTKTPIKQKYHLFVVKMQITFDGDVTIIAKTKEEAVNIAEECDNDDINKHEGRYNCWEATDEVEQVPDKKLTAANLAEIKEKEIEEEGEKNEN